MYCSLAGLRVRIFSFFLSLCFIIMPHFSSSTLLYPSSFSLIPNSFLLIIVIIILFHITGSDLGQRPEAFCGANCLAQSRGVCGWRYFALHFEHPRRPREPPELAEYSISRPLDAASVAETLGGVLVSVLLLGCFRFFTAFVAVLECTVATKKLASIIYISLGWCC